MAVSTAHRGPDETKIISQKEFAIGFNRLKIVGGIQGYQPISNEKNTIFLVCNGEIFNYRELVKRHNGNHNYKTSSDVEVILHLYEEYGTKFIQLLEGQFAFAIVDKNKRQIIIARDKFGINPLFYYKKDQLLIIASEIKAIFNSGLINNISLDQNGIAESWFFYGPIPPKTSFIDIFQLPPGSFGVYKMDTCKLNIKQYWSFKKQEGYSNLNKNLDLILSNSVKRRIQKDLKPGVYTSGGLDSSIIAYLVKKFSNKKPEFFSITFKNKKFDESIFQNQLSKFLKCRLNRVSVDAKIIVDNIEQSLMHIETPLIRSAPIPLMLLSKIARKRGIKYVLCGEGADELFLGYPVFIKGKSSIHEKWTENKKYISFFKESATGKKIKDEYKQFSKVRKDSRFLTLRKIEMQTKLSQYLLTNQGDRMSMANGVEQRFPYLDSEVVDYALYINPDKLLNGIIGKYILRKAFADVLPKALIHRQKQGYLTPDIDVVRELLRYKKYSKFLSEESINKLSIFDHEKVRKLVNNFSQPAVRETDARFLLFIITTQYLAEVFRHYLERSN